MGPRGFDDWTRTVRHAQSRRGALKVVAGMAMAGVLTRLALRGTAACTEKAGAACDPAFGCCADAGL
jgi:hypothetical protein